MLGGEERFHGFFFTSKHLTFYQISTHEILNKYFKVSSCTCAKHSWRHGTWTETYRKFWVSAFFTMIVIRFRCHGCSFRRHQLNCYTFLMWNSNKSYKELSEQPWSSRPEWRNIHSLAGKFFLYRGVSSVNEDFVMFCPWCEKKNQVVLGIPRKR